MCVGVSGVLILMVFVFVWFVLKISCSNFVWFVLIRLVMLKIFFGVMLKFILCMVGVCVRLVICSVGELLLIYGLWVVCCDLDEVVMLWLIIVWISVFCVIVVVGVLVISLLLCSMMM